VLCCAFAQGLERVGWSAGHRLWAKVLSPALWGASPFRTRSAFVTVCCQVVSAVFAFGRLSASQMAFVRKNGRVLSKLTERLRASPSSPALDAMADAAPSASLVPSAAAAVQSAVADGDVSTPSPAQEAALAPADRAVLQWFRQRICGLRPDVLALLSVWTLLVVAFDPIMWLTVGTPIHQMLALCSYVPSPYAFVRVFCFSVPCQMRSLSSGCCTVSSTVGSATGLPPARECS
jgi:hypothetical protein